VDAGGTLRFNAARGEVNNVNATDNTGDGTVVTDPGSIIRVGNGCVAVTLHEARCALSPLDNQDVVVDLADRDDSARWVKFGFGRIRIAGGAGDDTIVDAPQSGAEVSGGPGGDTITVAPNGFGRVDVNGDAGHDSITARGSGVVDGGVGDDEITLNGFVDGAEGSAARGGPGDDTISAKTVGMSLIEGGLGDDAITTSESATVSVIDGGPGADTVTSRNADGSSEINGGLGRDVVDGGGGGDRINCGLGIDRYVVYEGDTVKNCEIPFAPDARASV
jgi:hypothetical protein